MTARERKRVEHVVNRLRGREIAVRFVYDYECRFEECTGKPKPLTEAEYAEKQYMKNDGQTPIPYAEYLEYYGNPARHVYLGCITEHRPINCGCDDENCECWDTIGSVWGIDIMDDDPALEIVTIGIRMSLAEARAQLPGWLLECIADEAEDEL